MRDAGARAALVVQLLLQRRLNVQLLLQREKTDYSENKQPSLFVTSHLHKPQVVE